MSSEAPASEPKQPEQASFDNAASLIEQGQRLFDHAKYEQAAELFSQAVEKQITQYGEMATETVDGVIAYGKALLRNAVASSGVLGGASTNGAAPQPEQPPAAGPSSKPATTAQGSTTSTINQSSTKPHNPNFFFGGDVEEDEEDQTADNDQDAEQNGEGEEGEEDKEDDLETAFQMLDMARAILSKLDSDEAKLKLAGVHNALGEVATESERFDDAATEYLSALDVSSKVLPDHDRKIAEIHLMIALSYEFVPSTTKDINTAAGEASRIKAVEHAQKAKEVLVLRKKYLEAQDKTGDTEAELQDIDEVLTELDAKIEDLKTMSEDNKQAERNKQIDEALGMAKPTAAPDAPVNDLSGLVKKRKAPALTDTAPAASSCAPSLPKLGSTDQNASALTNSKGEQTEEGESATKKQKTET